MTQAFSGSKYNNIIPGITNNPFKYTFQQFGCNKTVTIDQNPNFGIAGAVWDCGVVLCDYLSMKSNCNRFNGATVVELGSGTAIGALVAWQLGAFTVATDLPEVIEVVTGPCIEANATDVDKKKRSMISAQTLSWGNMDEGTGVLSGIPVSELQKASQAKAKKGGKKGGAKVAVDGNALSARFDFIIMADVVYRSEDHMPLLETIMQIAHPDTTLIFVYKVRVNNDSNFVDALKEVFDVVCTTPVSKVTPKYPKDNCTIYEMKLKTSSK